VGARLDLGEQAMVDDPHDLGRKHRVSIRRRERLQSRGVEAPSSSQLEIHQLPEGGCQAAFQDVRLGAAETRQVFLGKIDPSCFAVLPQVS